MRSSKLSARRNFLLDQTARLSPRKKNTSKEYSVEKSPQQMLHLSIGCMNSQYNTIKVFCPHWSMVVGPTTQPIHFLPTQIDLTDMRHRPDGEYHWIGHYMDHWSKFHILFPLMHKSAHEVGYRLQENVFSYIGVPKILHSDNGREFVNNIVHSVV